MDAKALGNALGNEPSVNYAHELAGFVKACQAAHLTTPRRRAMFLAQVGEESWGLRYRTELADGSEYNGRSDLGNNYPGDGPRYKGRGYIQLTGRTNYGSFSRWAFSTGLAPNNHYFVDHPEKVAEEPWVWLSAAWYWMQPHPHNGMEFLNEAADRNDVATATQMINGGMNGYDERLRRWQHCMAMGSTLMGADEVTEDDINKIVARVTKAVLDQIGHQVWAYPIDRKGFDGVEGVHSAAWRLIDTEVNTRKIHPTPGSK